MRERTIQMPVDVGDRVFCSLPCRFYGMVQEYEVTNFMISKNKKGELKKKIRAIWISGGVLHDAPVEFSPEDIGVTVFATREEAERRANETDRR